MQFCIHHSFIIILQGGNKMDGLEFLLIGSDLQLESRAISEGRKAFFLGILPNCQSVDIIKAEQEKLNPYFTRVTLLKTPKKTLDAFLKEMFNGMELFDFMRTYAKLHIGEEFVLPVAESIICMFYNLSSGSADIMNSIIELNSFILTENLNDGPLHLHDNSITTFTLVKADGVDFNDLWGGHKYSTDNFNFFIKSSNQFDLTVFYEEKKAGK